METSKISSIVESILFAADRPVTMDRFSEVFGEEGPSKNAITEALEALTTRYQDDAYGFELRQTQGGYQFTTKPTNAEWVRKFLETKPFRLGRSALEVLAIIAYRQPITRAEIDQVRGIDSSHLMRTLMERGLVKMSGKAEVPGRPVQYSTSQRFIEVLGLNSLAELPPLSELQQLQGDSEDPLKSLETGLDRFIAQDLNHQTPVGNEDLQQGLEEISTVIEGADRSQDEVYQSKEHAEVARSNQEALKAFQSSTPFRRKKRTVTFDELNDSRAEAAAPVSETPASEDMPLVETTAEAAEEAPPVVN